MVLKVFEILFILALAAPPVAVALGIVVLLFAPSRTRRASQTEHPIGAAA